MLVLAEIMIQGQIDPRSVNAKKRNNKFIARKKGSQVMLVLAEIMIQGQIDPRC